MAARKSTALSALAALTVTSVLFAGAGGAAGAVPGTYKGKTAQGHAVTVFVGEDGLPDQVRVKRFQLSCRSDYGFDLHNLTFGRDRYDPTEELDVSTQTKLADRADPPYETFRVSGTYRPKRQLWRGELHGRWPPRDCRGTTITWKARLSSDRTAGPGFYGGESKFTGISRTRVKNSAASA